MSSSVRSHICQLRLGQEPISIVRRFLFWRHSVVRKLQEPTVSATVRRIVTVIELHIFFAAGAEDIYMPLSLSEGRHIGNLFPEGIRPEMAVQFTIAQVIGAFKINA